MAVENNLTWEEFMRVDMRVGTIISTEINKAARKPAYILVVDFGEIGIKKSSAQITDLYQLETLVGQQVIAVVNFPSKQIATMVSECLVLGSVDENHIVTLLQPERHVKNGTRIS